MATRSNHAPGGKRGEERRRKKEKKDGRLAPFGIVAHQSTSGIRTLSGLAVLREGLTAMQTTATDDGDERRRYNEWLLGGELDGDAEDDDERCQRTTATRRITSRPGCDSVADLDPLRHPITPPLPGRKPRPERVVRRRGDAKAPAIPAGQPEQFSRAAALTTASSGGWWGLFLPRSELSAGARREEDMMMSTLIRTVPSGGPSLAWSVAAPTGGGHKP